MTTPKKDMLFGFPRWDVEDAANTLTRAQELETMKPDIFAAALKLIERRQKMGTAILQSAKRKGD